MTDQSTIIPLPLTEEEEKLAKLIAEILVDRILLTPKTNTNADQ